MDPSSADPNISVDFGWPDPRREWPLSYHAVGPVVVALDVLLILNTSVLGCGLYHLTCYAQFGDVLQLLALGGIVTALIVPVLMLHGHYDPMRLLSRRTQFVQLISTWCLVFLFLFGIAFAMKVGELYSRGAVLTFFGLGLIGLMAHRVLWQLILMTALSQGRLRGLAILLLWDNDEADHLAHITRLRRYGYRVVRHLPLPLYCHEANPEALHATADHLLALLRETSAQEIFIATNWSKRSDEIQELIRFLGIVPVPIRLLPDRILVDLLGRQSSSGFAPFLTIELQRAPLRRYEQRIKRCFDIAFSLITLAILLPFFIIIGLLIWVESGRPIIFYQTRSGFNNRPFTMYKFRTMTVLENGPAIRQARLNDPRVTRVGRWLRRTSFDELPQFVNILKGNMSVVGPRPHAIAHDTEYSRCIAKYAWRYHVKPGLTGWAQVNGMRGETSSIDRMRHRVDLDLWYITHWSFWLDLLIIYRSAFEPFHSPNAY